MKKIISTIVGVLASIGIGILAINLFVNPIQDSIGSSPESFMWIVYLIIYPTSIYLGSIVTGFLLNKWKSRPFIKLIKYSPGIYLSIPYVVTIFGAPVLVLFMLFSLVLNISMSIAGLYMGIKLQEKINV